jgi:hypothetical protein
MFSVIGIALDKKLTLAPVCGIIHPLKSQPGVAGSMLFDSRRCI